MHSGIVNGYYRLCNAYTVQEQHKGTVALFLSILLTFDISAISFVCLSL